MDKRMFRIPIMFRRGLIAGLLLFAPIGFAQVPGLLPNLKALPPFDVDLVGGSKLIFSATTWNSGKGPLTLIGGGGGKKKGKVYQRIELANETFYDRHAGTFVWHPGHHHFHFERYALYTLQPVDAPGLSQRTSAKTTFCVVDTDHVDPGLLNSPQNPVYAFCGANVQGMSVGWGDTYVNTLSGQSIDLTGLLSGYYKLFIEADPDKRLDETNETDNVACSLLYLDITGPRVEVVDPAGC